MRITKTPLGWRVDFYHPFKPTIRIRKVFRVKTKQTAQHLADQLRLRLTLPANNHEIQTKLLRDAVALYLEAKSSLKSESAKRIDRLSLDLLQQQLGNVELNTIQTDKLETITSKLKLAGIKKSTINRKVGAIRTFFKWCHSHKWCPFDYSANVPKVKHGPLREARRLSDSEISRIYAEASECLKMQIQIAVTLGLRRAEIASLDWKSINFQNRLIQIGGRSDFSTKTGKSRVLNLPPDLLIALKRYRLKVNSKWLFPNKSGTGHVCPLVISRSFARARSRSKVEDVIFHDLRATAATRLAEQGLSNTGIAKQLGHTSLSMAIKYSNRIDEGVIKDALVRLEESTQHLFA